MVLVSQSCFERSKAVLAWRKAGVA
ncbi:hypothetical protein PPSIR1_22279 [Plesiocystis pacifica SIR-1]|uniref:Uncharacterized protein n=1 Tax=Plesiocystis pacifica SIR-1 TaxID=391625 RepID=A6FXV3_9BACT|nr:hypothetical protein PPSIR1_22279 [Plesiocystis pacifica SIR-1]